LETEVIPIVKKKDSDVLLRFRAIWTIGMFIEFLSGKEAKNVAL